LFPRQFPDIDTLIAERLTIDSESWRPAYGELSSETGALCHEAFAQGVVLDSTFTAKTFASLKKFGSEGLFRNSTVLFWNTYNRFDYKRLLI
jgi:hypothetical protein